ncbi:hypothetical protein AB0O64_05885 [Streptomyces sp. NPDC088341]|uniref:hypothetical protein n=1 Tax=Streptomyces sp. NPDC088341 TaxID=3154870 RepID=UPI003426D9BD
MSTTASEPTPPFIARMRQVTDVERARLEKAEATAAEAAATVAEVERILREALAGQRVALEERRVASERHEAALSTTQAAEAYAAWAGFTDTQHTDAAGSESDTASPQGSAARALVHLVVDALELGKDTALPTVYEKVRSLRPESTNNAIRATMSQLHKADCVEIVSRGVYRLLKLPEDYQTDG